MDTAYKPLKISYSKEESKYIDDSVILGNEDDSDEEKVFTNTRMGEKDV